jgi:hypothetical protein
LSQFTNEGEVQLLSYVLKGVTLKADGFGGSTAFTPSDTGGANQGVYISLHHTASPGENGVLTNEVSTSGTGYSRKLVAFTAGTESTSTDTALGTVMSNSAQISWTATGDWNGSSNITHFGLHFGSGYSAGPPVVSNTMFMYGALTVAKPVTNGDTVTIAAADIDITLK